MKYTRQHNFDLPLFDFEPETPLPDAAHQLHLRHAISEHSRDVLEVRSFDESDTRLSRWRFPITNDEEQECTARNDDEPLPTPVIWAVHKHGYTITNIESLPKESLFLRELSALYTRIEEWQDLYSDDLPIIHGNLDTLAETIPNIIEFLYLQRELGLDDLHAELDDVAVDVLGDTPSHGQSTYADTNELYKALVQHLQDRLEDVLDDGRDGDLPVYEWPSPLITSETLTVDGTTKVFVTLFSPAGAERYEFIRQTPTTAVYEQTPMQPHAPMEALEHLTEEHNLTVTNDASIHADANDPGETLTNALTAIDRLLSWYQQSYDLAYFLVRSLKNHVKDARFILNLHALFDSDDEYKRAYQSVCAQHNVRSFTELTGEDYSKANFQLASFLPEDVHDEAKAVYKNASNDQEELTIHDHTLQLT